MSEDRPWTRVDGRVRLVWLSWLQGTVLVHVSIYQGSHFGYLFLTHRHFAMALISTPLPHRTSENNLRLPGAAMTSGLHLFGSWRRQVDICVCGRVFVFLRVPAHQLTWKCIDPSRKTAFLLERAFFALPC